MSTIKHALRKKDVTWQEPRGRRIVEMEMITTYGLNYIQGNRSPYFSVTCSGRTNGREDFGGADHDLIEEHHPELADIIALHLSDMDGAPMYAEENGWHWLAKAAGIEQRWGPEQDAETCREIFAKHIRADLETVDKIIVQVQEATKASNELITAAEMARDEWGHICDGMRARWKEEADACIEKYGLTVSGDTWPPVPKIVEALVGKEDENVNG